MRRVTGRAAFSLQRGVFERKGALLVRVALDASCISTGGEPGLLQFKAAVRIVAVAALHHSFENFMVERLVEIWLGFLMATHAELRFAGFQHVNCREARLFGARRRDPGD